MDDPRKEFLNNVIFKNITIKEYPKIVFLCGGSHKVLSNSDDDEQHFPSVRSYISRLLDIHLSSLRYQNAEDIKDWNNYRAYEDLIEFEKDIAQICRAIVLVVESPGSIAELGSFVLIPEITEKLIVFIHSIHSETPSFISLGPLNRLNIIRENRVHYITWGLEKRIINRNRIDVIQPGSIKKWDTYICDSIDSFVNTRTHTSHSSDKYKRTKEALFIHDIIKLFKAITKDEIIEYFKLVNHEIHKKNITKYLFCLEKLELVRPIYRGNKTYYTPDSESSSRYLSLNSGMNSSRLAIRLSEYYEHTSQVARREAIETLMGGQ